MRSTVGKLLLSCAFFGSIAASAQSSVRVNFPFSFVADGKSLRAGHYEVIDDLSFVTLVNESDPHKPSNKFLPPLIRGSLTLI
jgi:hypothetical protein